MSFQIERNQEDVLGNVMEGAQGDGKLGAKSTQHSGHTAQQKPSNTSQRAAGVCPVQPGNNVKLPASAQTRDRLPPSSSGHLKSSLNPGVTLPRPMVKEGMDRKERKVVPPGHTAASQGTGHPNQSCSIHNSKTPVLEDDLRSRRDELKPELPKASGMQARRIPRIPSAADRK